MATKPPVFGVGGLNDLRKALKDCKDGLNDLKAANRDAAEIVAEYAVGYAPVESGDMAATIRSGGGPAAGTVKVGTKKYPYGGVINWGYKKGEPIKGDFFMQKAAQNHETAWVPAYENALLEIVDKYLTGRTFT